MIFNLENIPELEGDNIIPIVSSVDDIKFNEGEKLDLPILPIRNAVLFPGVVIPITVGRERSVRLVKNTYKGNKIIGVVAQKNSNMDDPSVEDLYTIGTIAKILKVLVLPDGNTTVIIQGKAKFSLIDVIKESPYIVAMVEALGKDAPIKNKKERAALKQALKEAAEKILKLNPEIPQDAHSFLETFDNLEFLAHFLSSNLNVSVKEKQELLELKDAKTRATKLLQHLLKEIQLLEIKQEIHTKAHSDIDQQQRDYFLRQQMKVLQDELGVAGSGKELEELRAKGEKKKWPEYAKKHFLKELDKLERMNPAAAEYPISMNYCELMVDLPWDTITSDKFDIKHAEKTLDKDHYGLDKTKERIIEYLAVLKLKKDIKGPILCLYGPPGVGKTSLGRSIAKALGRKYARMSLGGLRDEAEIRGHRKTYIGAMPGKILGNLKKAGSSNPVFILDEIDKIGSDFRGDPSSAFLEVLDPEQNSSFVDNFLEIEYDLSKVLFIATANSLDTIHPALRDRMEIIEINGYTPEEKIQIAKKHLIPKQRKEHGLTANQISFDEKSIRAVIEGHTRESGVRNLERELASIIRKVAKSVALEEDYNKKIGIKEVEKLLGVAKFESELYQGNDIAGVVTGLAWTPSGGEILHIESLLSKGKGKVILSGKLGDVMKESATAALSYLKYKADEIGIKHKVFDQYDLHLHVPAGAIPKDGPSAGITILTSLASVFTQRKIKDKLAMTGEITLRGKVLPVGGIKEKLLAARRAGIKEIIFSKSNEKEVNEIDDKYLKNLKLHFVDNADEVLEIALLESKVKNPIQFDLEENSKSTVSGEA